MVKRFGKPNVLLQIINHQMYQLLLRDICFESKFDDLIQKIHNLPFHFNLVI